MTGIVWGGGEMGAFVPSDSTIVEVTGAGLYGSGARCALQCNDIAGGAGGYAASPVFTSLTNFWLHFDVNTGGGQSNFPGPYDFLHVLDNTGQIVFKLTWTCVASDLGGRFQAYYWTTGTTFVAIGPNFYCPFVLNTFDLNVNFMGGSYALYSAGTSVSSGTASFGGANGSQLIFILGSLFFTPAISKCIASGQSTVGANLVTAPITGAGLTSSWTGVYTDVNEIVYNDANFISSGSANQISNFAQATTVSQPINAVIVTARANVGGTGPQNLQLDLNVAATNYFSSTVAQTAGFSASVGVWLTNPNTSAAWAAADWTSSVYYGVKSIA